MRLIALDLRHPPPQFTRLNLQFRQDPVRTMSGLYASLGVSPKKKRCPPELDDETTFTPKKLRAAYARSQQFDLS